MDYQAWLKAAAEYFHQSWGVTPTFAGQVALLYLYLASYGLNPQINSGYRSAAKQAAMRADWDAGRRSGLKTRPALSSSHTKGIAVDISTSNPRMAGQIAAKLNIGWGGLDDDVHFFKRG